MHAEERLTRRPAAFHDGDGDFWHLDDTASIRLWLQVGLPDERLLRSGRPTRWCSMHLRPQGRGLAPGPITPRRWPAVEAHHLYLPDDECEALLPLVERTMRLGANYPGRPAAAGRRQGQAVETHAAASRQSAGRRA